MINEITSLKKGSWLEIGITCGVGIARGAWWLVPCAAMLWPE